jgi:hypothetical protein
MTGWRDRLNRMGGRTRFAVCRIFVHLAGDEVAPLLGILNRAAREAVESEGDMDVIAEGLVEICESLLQYDLYWQSAANEGDMFWDEGEAGDYVTELFTDSAQRYGVAEPVNLADDESFSIPVTQNLVVILTVAYEGEVPTLETDLASMSALRAGLKALINLRYDNKLRAIQVHYSPAQLGDVLTQEQLILNFPELIPL